MPTYSFICESCHKVFEVFLSFKEYDEKNNIACELCGSKKVCRNYVEDALSVGSSVRKADSELKTIGDLANRNRDRMTDDHKAALYEKHNSYKDEADKKPMPTGMSRMKKPKQKFKWR